MPQQNEPIYCSQQINIPPELPDILKQFTKAAIRTQPPDVLQWAYAYFDALAKGETPPVKDRLETQLGQPLEKPLTQGLLAVLHKQLGSKSVIELSSLEEKWKHLCLPKSMLDDLLRFQINDEIIRLGSFAEEIKWLHFFSLACSAISENLTIAMKTVCEILTTDLQGGPARIPFSLFRELYTYLATMDGEIPKEHVDTVIDHLSYDVEKQEGMVLPRNFMSDSCPPLSPSQ